MISSVVNQALINAVGRLTVSKIVEIKPLPKEDSIQTHSEDLSVQGKATKLNISEEPSQQLQETSAFDITVQKQDSLDESSSLKSERYVPPSNDSLRDNTSEKQVVPPTSVAPVSSTTEEESYYQDDYESVSVKKEPSTVAPNKATFNDSLASGSMVEGSEYAYENASFEMADSAEMM